MRKLLLPAVAAALAAVVAASAEPVSHAAPPPPAGMDPSLGAEPAKALQTNVLRLEHQIDALQLSAGKTAPRLQP
jgi:hypothetical protein